MEHCPRKLGRGGGTYPNLVIIYCVLFSTFPFWLFRNFLFHYNKNRMNVFKVINMMFYILLHATPQTHLEQAVPLYLSASWSILVGRCESIKWNDCPQFEKHYSALHILFITFSIRELESVPLIPFHPYTLSLFILLEKSSHQQLHLLQELTILFFHLS